MERLPYILVLAGYAYIAVAHLLPAVFTGAARKWMRPIGLIAVIVHLLTLGAAAVIHSHGPGFAEALSATSLGVALAYAYVSREQRLSALGMFLSPLALVLLGTAMVVPTSTVTAMAQTGFSPWLPVHLTLVFAGTGGFALASVVGGTYLWVRNRLKAKSLANIRRLPSLEVLDRVQFRAMLFGFIFLTLGIGTGGMLAAVSPIHGWILDPKVVFTVLVWLWYGIGLQVRLVLGQRGRWTAIFSIAGFIGLIGSMLGVNFLLSGFHGYGG